MAPTASLVREHPDGNDVAGREDHVRIAFRQRVTAGDAVRHVLKRGHGFHPCRIFSHSSTALRSASGVVAIFFGHGRLKPSDGHFRVASMPILLPYAARSLASSRSSTGPRVN